MGTLIGVACTGADPVPSSVAATDAANGADDNPGVVASDASQTSDDGGVLDAAPAPELLLNSSFEMGNCQFWGGSGATDLTAYQPAYDGRYACRACAQSGQSTYGISQEVPLEWLGDAGGRFEASFFVRLPDADAGVVASEELVLAATLYAGAEPVGISEQPIHPRSTEWTQYTYPITYLPDSGANHLYVYVTNRRGDDGCFYVDRASFVRTTH